MSGQTLRRDGAISVISLSEPANARLTLKDMSVLADAFEEAGADRDSRVILVEGPAGTFCAGGDLSDFLNCRNLDELDAVVRRFFLALSQSDKPLVAAVDGAAVGLGMTMLLHFDAVFATPESSFVAPFSDLGLVPEAGSTLLAPMRFGYLRAFDLMCVGRALTAAEALGVGLVSEVTESAGSTARARSVAARLARKPEHALRVTRRLLRGHQGDLAKRIDIEIGQFRRLLEDAATVRRLTRLTRGRPPAAIEVAA